jgi:hypothetical protein
MKKLQVLKKAAPGFTRVSPIRGQALLEPFLDILPSFCNIFLFKVCDPPHKMIPNDYKRIDRGYGY